MKQINVYFEGVDETMVDNRLASFSLAENNWRVFYFRKLADFYGDRWRILAAT
jgi:hypothetical protein